MSKEKAQIEQIPLNWLRWIAITTAVLSSSAAIGLSIPNAWAQDPAQKVPPAKQQSGFKAGKKNFSNPANLAPPTGEPEQISISKPGAKRPQDSVPDPQFEGDEISVGGDLPGGVKNDNAPSPIDIGSFSGGGSDAVITDFNFPDADILDIAKTLGKLTGKNFVYDKNVKGRVTIISNGPITVGDAWRAFLTALDINNYALIPSGSFIRITRQRDARDKQLNTYTGEFSPNTDALITRVFPLKYISAEEVSRTFRSFMPANARIIPYAQTNTVIVTDTGSNIQKLSKMLEFLDVEGFDAGIEVIPVQHASAAEIAKLIDELIPGTTTSRGKSRRGRNSKSNFSSRKTKEGGIINTIIADERTNALIVHANARGADEVKALVRKLDTESPSQVGGGRIRVIYLQFADAEELAKTMQGLAQGSGSNTSNSSRNTRNTNRRTTRNQRNQNTPSSSGAALFEGQVKISADKATNSLVVTASPSDFVTLQRVVNQLDIPRDQVYIETIIMEMTIGDNFEFSTSTLALTPWGTVGFQQGDDLLQVLTNPLSQKGLLLGFASSDTQDFNIGGNTVQVSTVNGLVKALQTYSKANVLATPQIMTLDNKEATFESSERIPVPSVTAGTNQATTSISYENIGLEIKITPQINKVSNYVKLDIESKLEDISAREPPAQVRGLAFATIRRNAKTSVVVADNDTVVIGGLIRDKQEDTESKIPILGDIPILGWLFKKSGSAVTKTNLLMFLTPRIVKQYEKVRAILDKKLYQRDKFIENNAGGEDPLREYRDDMIRELPDIEDVLAKQGSPYALPKSVDDDGEEDRVANEVFSNDDLADVESLDEELIDLEAVESAPLADPNAAPVENE